MKIGTCGWAWFPEKGNRLENYVRAFGVVEVNSTFYRLPKKSTAEKWRKIADKINKDFEFVVKVPKEITHIRRFKNSIDVWEKTLEIGDALRARIYLFQTSAKFIPNKDNIERATSFFKEIKRQGTLAWEVRWADKWKEEIVNELFEKLDIIHVVDPFRQPAFRKNQPFSYYRIHGFGKPMMYSYKFSEEELLKLIKIVKDKDYVLFNNMYMYEDALRFITLLKSSRI